MASPSPGSRRIKTDLMKLIESKHPVAILRGTNEFIVKMYGPKDTAYEGGQWNVRVELPERYPYKSPSIGFQNKIFHPNIDEPSGSVCLDVINQTWTPLYDIVNIFEQFIPQLLTYPNPQDPLNSEAANMYLHDSDNYHKRVRDSVQRYATKKCLAEKDAQFSWCNLDESEDEEEPQNDNENETRSAQNSDDGNLSEMSDAELEMEF